MVDVFENIKNKIIAKINRKNHIEKNEDEVGLLLKSSSNNDNRNSNKKSQNAATKGIYAISIFYFTIQIGIIFGIIGLSYKDEKVFQSPIETLLNYPFLFNMECSLIVLSSCVMITGKIYGMKLMLENKSNNVLDVFCLYFSFLFGIGSQILLYVISIIPFVTQFLTINATFQNEIKFSLYEIMFYSIMFMSILYGVFIAIIRDLPVDEKIFTKFNLLLSFNFILLISSFESRLVQVHQIFQNVSFYSLYFGNSLIYFSSIYIV